MLHLEDIFMLKYSKVLVFDIKDIILVEKGKLLWFYLKTL